MTGLCSGAAGATALAATGRSGTSEFYLHFTLRHLPGLLESCLGSEACYDGIEKLLNQLIVAQTTQPTYLDFLSSRELGNHVFRLERGGIVSVNRDMLFIGRNGTLDPYIYPDAVSFFIDMWGERLRWTENQVRILSYRLNDLVSRNFSRVSPAEPHLKQFAYGLVRVPHDALILEDSSVHELSSTLEIPFETSLSCGTATGREGNLHNVKITSVSWVPASRLNASRIQLSVLGMISYRCPRENGLQSGFVSNYVVQIDAEAKSGRWRLNTGTLRIQQNNIRPH